ncbi:hypothetical protein [Pseudonocardia sp. KRD291]|uniref:hypothetical protein n=1 Tax=Pseudonocardia sp. KRD291 TaxID=2792007 RepID=UPI0027E31158|nr:hypothetical protein [Pseudonocardia sp. KRD291]
MAVAVAMTVAVLVGLFIAVPDDVYGLGRVLDAVSGSGSTGMRGVVRMLARVTGVCIRARVCSVRVAHGCDDALPKRIMQPCARTRT